MKTETKNALGLKTVLSKSFDGMDNSLNVTTTDGEWTILVDEIASDRVIPLFFDGFGNANIHGGTEVCEDVFSEFERESESIISQDARDDINKIIKALFEGLTLKEIF